MLRFPSLIGNEVFTISMIDTLRELPAVINVRSDEGLGKQVPMMPQRVWPPMFLYSLMAVLLVGFSALFYFLLQFGITIFSIYALFPK